MKKYILLILTSVLVIACKTTKDETIELPEKYEPNWSSIRKHDTPEWLDGLKFGIYFHWGPQTIQIASGNKEMTTLQAIEQWTGKNFDAKAWVDLIEASGAQFGGPVAWHGSGLLNWDSDLTDWNSVDKGPQVDIFGSLVAELRKRNMKVISSYHTSSVWGVTWGPISHKDSTYLDPYNDNTEYETMNNGRIGDVIFDGWFDRISEAVEKYQPDMLWFDVGFGGTVATELKDRSYMGRLLPDVDNQLRTIPEDYQQKLLSYYYNKGLEWNKEVEIIYKSHDVPPGIGMRDIENGNLIGLQYDPWMADINMAQHHKWPSPWFYNPENPMKDAGILVDMLVDMTSKNGRMLLNVPPLPDGTFSEEQKKELHAMGEWLKINGEAIYNTIPWVFFGEGPTEVTNPGHHGQGKQRGELIPQYTPEDIRFTQKANILYAICLDWPGEDLLIRTLGSNCKLHPGDVKSISMLGSREDIKCEHRPEGLFVKLPDERPCDFAYVLRIERSWED